MFLSGPSKVWFESLVFEEPKVWSLCRICNICIIILLFQSLPRTIWVDVLWKLQSGKDTLFNHELPEPTGKKKFALGAKKIQKILPGQRGSSSICDDDLGWNQMQQTPVLTLPWSLWGQSKSDDRICSTFLVECDGTWLQLSAAETSWDLPRFQQFGWAGSGRGVGNRGRGVGNRGRGQDVAWCGMFQLLQGPSPTLVASPWMSMLIIPASDPSSWRIAFRAASYSETVIEISGKGLVSSIGLSTLRARYCGSLLPMLDVFAERTRKNTFLIIPLTTLKRRLFVFVLLMLETFLSKPSAQIQIMSMACTMVYEHVLAKLHRSCQIWPETEVSNGLYWSIRVRLKKSFVIKIVTSCCCYAASRKQRIRSCFNRGFFCFLPSRAVAVSVTQSSA